MIAIVRDLDPDLGRLDNHDNLGIGLSGSDFDLGLGLDRGLVRLGRSRCLRYWVDLVLYWKPL